MRSNQFTKQSMKAGSLFLLTFTLSLILPLASAEARTPEDGAILTEWPADLRCFDWSNVMSEFHLWPVSNPDADTVILSPAGGSLFLSQSDIEANTTYAWRSRGLVHDNVDHNNDYWGPWSGVWTFTSPPPLPEGPSPISPNGITVYLPVEFEWTEDKDAVSYKILISNVGTYETAETRFVADIDILSADEVYYWQARSLYSDGSYSLWGEQASVTIDCRSVAGPSEYSMMPENGYLEAGEITFEWDDVENKGYHLQIDTSSENFLGTGALFIDTIIETSSITLEVPGGPTFWRVSTFGADTIWSELCNPYPKWYSPNLTIGRFPADGAVLTAWPVDLYDFQYCCMVMYTVWPQDNPWDSVQFIDIEQKPRLSEQSTKHGTIYEWHVRYAFPPPPLMDPDWGPPSEIWSFTTPGIVTVIEEISPKSLPETVRLFQNYPNPFNPTTEISFSTAKLSRVRVDIINVLGQTVDQLINRQLPAGYHSVTWDGTKHSSGIYFYRLQVGPISETRKMILIK